MKYGWIITEDFMADKGTPAGTNCNAVGVMGPHDCQFTKEEIKEKGKEFKMYDDDGELYYKSILLGDSGLEPLDDFGAPNAGVSSIFVDGVQI